MAWSLLCASEVFHPCRLKLIALLPAYQLVLRCGFPSQHETESCHGSIAREIHAGMIFITRLMIALRGVLFGLLQAPGGLVSLIFCALVHRESRNAHACQTEVVGAVVVSGLGARIRTNLQAKRSCHGLDRRIKGGALRSRNLHLLGRAERRSVIIVEVKTDFFSRNRRMLATLFRAQQTLLLGGHRGKKNRPSGPLPR